MLGSANFVHILMAFLQSLLILGQIITRLRLKGISSNTNLWLG